MFKRQVLQMWWQADLSEFKASLGYKVSSRTARSIILKNPVLKKKNRHVLLLTKPSPSPGPLNLIFLLPVQLGHDPIRDPASPDRLLSAVTSPVGNHGLLWSSTSYHLTFSRDSKENLYVCEFIAYVSGISFTIANEEYAMTFLSLILYT